MVSRYLLMRAMSVTVLHSVSSLVPDLEKRCNLDLDLSGGFLCV